MILLNDVLNFSESELKNIKIRFNQSNNNDFYLIKLFKEKDKGLYDDNFGITLKQNPFK